MKKIRQRSLAAVLIVALLASTLGIVNSIAAEKIRIANWPAIMGFTAGTKPNVEGWEFNMKDYGEKAEMQVSDSDFKAPKATWDANDNVPKFSWDAISGAARYDVNIYEGTTLVKTYSVTENSFAAAQNNTIPAGVDYEVQVVAYGADDSKISASCIRKFTAEGKVSYHQVITDFTDADSSAVYAVRNNKLTYNIADGVVDVTANDNANAIYFRFPYGSEKAFKDNTGNANFIYIKMKTAPGFGSKTKMGFSTSQTGGKVSAVDSSVKYDKYANIYNVYLTDNRVDWTAVSVENPTKTTSVAMLSTKMGGYVPYEFDSLSGGYYYVVPLSAYSDTMQADIKSGTFDVFGMQFETSLAYDTAKENMLPLLLRYRVKLRLMKSDLLQIIQHG